MNEQQVEEQETEKPVERRQPRQDWGRQTIGSIIGGAVGLLIAMGLRQLGWGGETLLPFVLWGAVVGAMLSNIEALENAGQRLTRRDARWLNVGVSILGMVFIFAFIFALAQLVLFVLRLLASS
jgi:D-alanyl-lipoteichoic acid acyltransferase DltB (MBOAT superfamily)